ncbi:H-NS family nucleoid-associated regulatory protein [Vibrio sp. PNB22_3_1]
MSIEVGKRLLNIKRLRNSLADLTMNQLRDALENFTLIVRERSDEEALLREKEVERCNRLNQIVEMMGNLNISSKELIDYITLIEAQSSSVRNQKGGRVSRKPRPPKYQYTTIDGERRTWTGQGRTPSVIQSAIDNGAKLTDFIIT